MDDRVGVLQAGLDNVVGGFHARVNIRYELQNVSGVVPWQRGQQVAGPELEENVYTSRFSQTNRVVKRGSFGNPDRVVIQRKARRAFEGKRAAAGTRADDDGLAGLQFAV